MANQSDYTIIIRHNTSGRSASMKFSSKQVINETGLQPVLEGVSDLLDTILMPETKEGQLAEIEQKIGALMEQKRLLMKSQGKDCGCPGCG